MAHNTVLRVNSLTPFRENVFVTNMEGQGEQITKKGIIVMADDGATRLSGERGIRPRWCQVWAVGPEAPEEFVVGHWILLQHGKLQPRIRLETPTGEIDIWRISNEGAMMVSEEDPRENQQIKF